jgi:uncharacterized protein
MDDTQQVIEQTKKWITDVVVGCNFCPFAAKAIKQQTIHYQVEYSTDSTICLDAFLAEVIRLDDTLSIETSFLIFPNSFAQFDNYLDIVALAEELLIEKGYEGIYQVASFHPQYQFADSHEKDAANYTNRSVYPMLHLLRESSIDKALENYKDPEGIPAININFARNKGLLYMKMLRDSCL